MGQRTLNVWWINVRATPVARLVRLTVVPLVHEGRLFEVVLKISNSRVEDLIKAST